MDLKFGYSKKSLASFERKIRNRIFGATKIDKICNKKYDRQLENMFGDLNFVSFVRILVHRLKWIGHMNRVDADRILKSIFNNQLEGNRLRVRHRNHWCNCVQADLNKCKLFDWKKRSTDRDGWKKSIEEALGPDKRKKKIYQESYYIINNNNNN